ncbi:MULTISPECIES: MarR family winged helix-turn-helix transcriptional regulator [Streptomyces]|uniref:MarR family transcriptional regulator n=1 Tax=Streptomyces dengpaensis TaxID=2049881 RepID=A0ABM6T104_9ACTN|nr:MULTISPECIES: MarR family transcriptional regulator [Streptomyces]AVH60635.1 MarR family transcriptional regulator [Streptomyces dengpaensis]PIB02764.1 MarR family transcriptional regulator [Streptomyces sp. HG99]
MNTEFDPHSGGGDSVAAMLEQWGHQWPKLDVSSSAVIGRLLRAARLIEELVEDQLRRREGRAIANVGDFDLLQALRRTGPPYVLTPGQLKQALIVSSAGLSGRLNRLEREGWINRTMSPDDRRVSLVSLTEQGREDFDRRIEGHLALEQKLLSVLEPEERATVACALRKLLSSLETAP